jgi:hypothetical protein
MFWPSFTLANTLIPAIYLSGRCYSNAQSANMGDIKRATGNSISHILWLSYLLCPFFQDLALGQVRAQVVSISTCKEGIRVQDQGLCEPLYPRLIYFSCLVACRNTIQPEDGPSRGRAYLARLALLHQRRPQHPCRLVSHPRRAFPVLSQAQR